MFETLRLYTYLQKVNMFKDLFQINTEKDIYLTFDLWAVLPPHLAKEKNKPYDKQKKHEVRKAKVEDRGSSDVS